MEVMVLVKAEVFKVRVLAQVLVQVLVQVWAQVWVKVRVLELLDLVWD
jgi:hypothetical protein